MKQETGRIEYHVISGNNDHCSIFATWKEARDFVKHCLDLHGHAHIQLMSV